MHKHLWRRHAASLQRYCKSPSFGRTSVSVNGCLVRRSFVSTNRLWCGFLLCETFILMAHTPMRGATAERECSLL